MRGPLQIIVQHIENKIELMDVAVWSFGFPDRMTDKVFGLANACRRCRDADGEEVGLTAFRIPGPARLRRGPMNQGLAGGVRQARLVLGEG